jgi:tRNA(Ile)-lysidine synthase
VAGPGRRPDRLTAGFAGLEAPVVVACSGGPDSLALLALAAGAGLAPVAVHVDHGARPGSAAEGGVVAGFAGTLRTGFAGETVAVAPGPNFEARARNAHYGAWERARARLGATAVLVGHTRDDQAETVLLNVLRGAGLSGLAGMPARRGRVVRPLLGVPRADLAAVCRRLGLAPLDDPMNADPVHRRVWLRREVIPALEAGARRDLRVVLARQAAVARDDSELLDGLAAEVLGAAMVDGELQAKALATARVALARRAVRLWLGPPPPSSTDVDRVLSVARGEHRAVEVAGGVEVRRSGGRLRRLDVRCRQGTTTVQTIAVDLPGTACGHGLELTAWVERGIPVRWPDGRWTAVVDADLAGGRAVLRADDAGGAARLDSPDGSPLWVLGYRVADRVRVSPGTRRFLWLTVEAGGPRG